MISRFFLRHGPPAPPLAALLKFGAGAAIAIGAAAWLSSVVHTPMLLAPFGASAVLIFGLPASAFSQPANVVAGYALCATFSVLTALFGPPVWWATGLAVGACVIAMIGLRVVHPPAGSLPVLALMSHIPNHQLWLVAVLGSGAMCLYAALHHGLLPPRRSYPLIGPHEAPAVPHAEPQRRAA